MNHRYGLIGLFASIIFIFSIFIWFNRQHKPLFQTGPTVILVNFGSQDSDGKWTGEAAPYGQKLEKLKDISDQVPLCQNVYSGTISNQPVILAVSGMAKVRTAACTTNLLQYTKGRIREFILTGIGGISTQSVNGRSPKIGDVCINSLAVDFDRQYYTSDQAFNPASLPQFWAAAENSDPARRSSGSETLAAELYQAALSVSWPMPSRIINDLNQVYQIATGSAHIWEANQCLEVSGDLFWHDLVADKRAREMASEWMSSSRNIRLLPDQIVIITSMEAASAGTVIELWNARYSTAIPYAYVRSASNFDHTPTSNQGQPLLNGKDNIFAAMTSDHTSYAIDIQALPVLQMLILRNKLP